MKLAHPLRGLGMIAAAFTTSCSGAGTAPEAAPTSVAPPQVSAIASALYGSGSTNAGQRLFGSKCAFCHVGKTTGAMMLGRRLGKENADLTRRTDLQADYVKAVVRNGLVNMPAFSRVELTDAELDQVAAWLARKKR